MKHRLVLIVVMILSLSLNAQGINGSSTLEEDRNPQKIHDSQTAFWVSVPFLTLSFIATILSFVRFERKPEWMMSRAFRIASEVSMAGSAIWSATAGGIWGHTVKHAPSMASTSYDGPSDFAPVSIRFDGSLSNHLGERSITVWRWDFGDGFRQDTVVPTITHRFANAGTYMVRLTVEDDKGHQGSTSVTIQLRDGFPQPVFECHIISPIQFAPVNVSCDGSSSYSQAPNTTITHYEYDFADGRGYQNVGPVVPSYEIRNPGQYDVRLRVTDSAFNSRTVAHALVVPDGSPVSHLQVSYSNSFHSTPLNVTFDGSLSHTVYPNASMVYLGWTLPNEASFNRSANESAIFTRLFSTPGSYTATLQAFDDTGRRSSNTQNFVLQSPNPIASLGVSKSHSGNDPTVVTANGGGSRVNYPDSSIAGYWWKSDLAALTTPGYSLSSQMVTTPSQYGHHWVELSVQDSAGRVSTNQRVNFFVNSVPTARATCHFSAHSAVALLSGWCPILVTIECDGSASSDPAGAALSYRWHIGSSSMPNQSQVSTPRFTSTLSQLVTGSLTVANSEGYVSGQVTSSVYIPGCS